MPHKVLVFESDSAFASELRNELAKLDCHTIIVDDGNIGLQQAAADRPDLILLSIELPRMNGFSVCNKLKKDPQLRDVPLIIMSSESSGETFEQHRKLRTRAEDYVHKPIAFGELLQHIQAFVPLGVSDAGYGESGAESGIDIDDDVVEQPRDGSSFPGLRGRGTGRTALIQSSSTSEIDPDIDSFADAAFGMLQSGGGPERDAGAHAEPVHDHSDDETGEHQPEAPRTLDREHERDHERGREEVTRAIDASGANGVGGAASAMSGEEPRTMYHAKANVNPYGDGARGASPSHVGTEEGLPDEAARVHLASSRDDAARSEEIAQAAERLRDELAAANEKREALERELGGARDDLGRAQADLDKARDELGHAREHLEKSHEATLALERSHEEKATEAAALATSSTTSAEEIRRLQAEVEELKAKAAASATATANRAPASVSGTMPGTGSSREFLDLREASNRKDKEILSLKEALSRKDKEILEARERSLSLERTAGEQDDKMLALERELNQERERSEALTSDKEQAKKVGEDLRTRLHKAHADIEAREKDVAEGKDRLAEEAATREAALASAHAEHAEAVTRLKAQHEEALADAREIASKERQAAVTAREQEMQKESDGKLAALHRAQQDEIGRLKSDFERERQETAQRNEATLAAAETRRQEELAEAQRNAEVTLSARTSELVAHEKESLEAAARESAEKVAALENDRDSRLAAIEARTTRELAEVRAVSEAQKLAADEQIAELTRELGSTRTQLAEMTHDRDRLSGELEATRNDLAARTHDLEAARERMAALGQELEATKVELGGTRDRLTHEAGRADRATSKWNSDRVSLERAKDALAVALAQIEETGERALG